ncbi:protein hunchback isoform X1 [Drosophila guanche]|uniref:Protein hunchback n=1 Tax=Drosophila guanche TaxID=7266 RepID=A0A3B0KG77_DROGU|nr:protein hunchback isoform X1 [Drosophila guanche]SPP84051.1 blast:Protein hunchback [Drosophila guanche]
MQNWETTPAASYEQHNPWYSSMFAANIKQEPGLTSGNSVASGSPSPRQSPLPSPGNHLEQYLKQQQQQHQQQMQQQPMDTLCGAAMTPSPSQNDQNSLQHFDVTLQQQLLQQQQYQQHFQAAQQQQQQAHHHHHHLGLGGFNPLTPPGLPNPMQHFYAGNLGRPSPQPTPTATQVVAPTQVGEKLQALTPPMDVTPPKSPAKSIEKELLHHEKEHDQMSNSSEDMKYMAESEDDDQNIRMPIYNSHGKMKNYKCKTCGVVAITKVDFWAHTRTHMKPDKILQCPKCPFVTEFKHHLEYHIRKHKNQKPFQCDKCSYTCVNKSMLNSHRKSHSSVYQYRCADCDYATKYCHSFKLHLRKYGHKPGMVLDEDGTPNPSLVIDVYGTRRGPKSKNGGTDRSSSSGTSSSSSRKSNVAAVAPQQQQQQPPVAAVTSQLSAALQGFTTSVAAPSPVMPASPAKSVASNSSKVDQQQQHQQQHQQQQQQQQQQSPANLLPPLASLLQQNRNMAFFPYWNLNLQMLAAQQQAAVLAQLSPRMREQLQQQQQQHHHSQSQHSDNEDEEQDDEYERKSVDSAMDLSQGTPVKDDEHHQQQQQQQQQKPLAMVMNLKHEEEATPLMSSTNASRRKGRVLKLDTLLQLKSAAMSSPEQVKVMPTASSPIAGRKQLPEEHCSGASSADESMETAHVPRANTSASSTASSSGNSSNASASSNGNSSSNSAAAAPVVASTPAAAGAIYECKYCDIFFKDAVLYTIHMGYHSCDDVFKCNMCGEKCDGPVGLFVHMARNAHS